VTTEVEFGAMVDADRFRDEYPEFRCPIDDDRRERTVHFTSDTPDHVLEEARAAATSGQAEREANEASGGTRELTESEKRALDFSRDGVSYVKAKAIANVADEYGVDAFEHVDPAEVDGADDARPIFERARRSGGTGRGGGTAQFDDEASEREQRERRMRAEQAEAQRCDHARDKCRAGEPEACEILQTRCGLSEAEANRLLSDREPGAPDAPDANAEEDSEPWIPPAKWDDLSGREKGAVANAAGGYHGAVDELRAAVSDAEQAFKNAQAAAKALNGLRAGVGEGPLHFSALEETNAALLDMVRMTAAYCHECHATHEDHNHDTTDGEREDLRAFVRSGASETPVGTAEEFGPAREAAEHPDAALAERAPEQRERRGVIDNFGGS